MKSRRRLPPVVVIPLVALAAMLLSCVLCFGLLALYAPDIWSPDFDFPEHPTNFYTAREAYDTALPQISSWHSDAFITYMEHGYAGNPEGWRLQPDGRGPAWSFHVSSPSAMEFTVITLIDDVTFVSGLDGHPARSYRGDALSIPPPMPSDWLIDSAQALFLAREAGSQGIPTLMRTTFFRGAANGALTGERIPLSWLLAYGDWGRPPYVIVDAYTGALYQNDFVP